jgi:hypothetical protein
MNELDGSRTPYHQFHAPLVAVVFWSLSAGIPTAESLGKRLCERRFSWLLQPSHLPSFLRHFVWTSAFATAIFFSLGPLGLKFWDPGSSWYWRRLYVMDHRATVFPRVAAVIPPTARVASTDFVHPRFTHCERSYDYSDYWRAINGPGNRIPEDTQYIVIDTKHRYSKIHRPEDVPELKEHPDKWELLPDQTDGDFIVLKRKQ